MKNFTLLDMSEFEFDNWLTSLTDERDGRPISDEERLVAAFSLVFHAKIPKEKAHRLMEVAKQCVALAELTLGAAPSSVKQLPLTRH